VKSKELEILKQRSAKPLLINLSDYLVGFQAIKKRLEM